MSTTVTVNGTSYAVPAEGDSSWATDVSNLLIALATSTKVLQTSSSTFTLTTDVNFGATYGPVATYYKSRGTNPASAGVFRLANAENISWRNAANSADLSLKLSASDWLQFNSVNLADISTAQTLTNKTLTAPVLNSPTGLAKADVGLGNVDNTSDSTKNSASATLTNKTISGSSNTLSNIAYSSLNLSTSIVNADISTSAAIARSKLATLSASKAVVTDGFGYDIASTTTSTEIGYLGGVTSAVQTQLDAKVSKSTATTKGDLFVATASATVTRLGVGSNNTFLKANSGATEGVEWASVAGAALAVTTKTTTYTATTADDVILVDTSGGAWTLTLYAASGNAGKVLTIKKTTSDFTALTIDANASETIDGQTTTTINTQFEAIRIICDGTNWHILERKIPSEWVSLTPTGSLSTNATYTGMRRRVGGNAEFRFKIAFSGTNTQGALTINLPVTIDTAKIPGTISGATVFGQGAARDSGSADFDIVVGYNSTTSVAVLLKTSSATYAYYAQVDTASNIPMTIANGDTIEVVFSVPVVDWKGN